MSARLLIRLFPASPESRKHIEAVRGEVTAISQPASALPDEWSQFQSRLRQDILTKDPRAFFTWDVIAETMCPPPHARFVRPELQYLKLHDWPTWSRVVRNDWFCRANAIHQAYHVCRFQIETASKIAEFDFILDFGGGYGEMRRILHGLGFSGTYVTFDLPEQSALQRYYLSTVGDPATLTLSDFNSVRATVQTAPQDSRKLFIATWSFSETSLELRSAWADLLTSFNAYLIAYQAYFGGVDNRACFSELQKRLPRVHWNEYPIPQLENSFYLFGTASGA